MKKHNITSTRFESSDWFISVRRSINYNRAHIILRRDFIRKMSDAKLGHMTITTKDTKKQHLRVINPTNGGLLFNFFIWYHNGKGTQQKEQANRQLLESGKNDRKIAIFAILLCIGMMIFFFNLARQEHLNAERLRSEGLTTTAIVTEVRRDDRPSDSRVSYRVTLEYEINGVNHVNIRNRTDRRNVGEIVEIYYDDQDPYTFVFADQRSYGIIFWLVMIFFTIAIFYSIYRIITNKPRQFIE